MTAETQLFQLGPERKVSAKHSEFASYFRKETAVTFEFQSDLKPACFRVIPTSNAHTQPPAGMTTHCRHCKGAKRPSPRSPLAPKHDARSWPGAGRGLHGGGLPQGLAATPLGDRTALRGARHSRQHQPSCQRVPDGGALHRPPSPPRRKRAPRAGAPLLVRRGSRPRPSRPPRG